MFHTLNNKLCKLLSFLVCWTFKKPYDSSYWWPLQAPGTRQLHTWQTRAHRPGWVLQVAEIHAHLKGTMENPNEEYLGVSKLGSMVSI